MSEDNGIQVVSGLDNGGTPNLNGALAIARGTFDWEELRRDGTGHYGKYLTLAKIYEATSSGLAENGLSLSHRIVNATLYASLRHSSGETVESEMPLGAPNQWQEYGKAMSYATRYAVQALLGIAGGEDLETDIDGLESSVPYQRNSNSNSNQTRSWQQDIADGTYDATFNYIEKNLNKRSDKSPIASITGDLASGQEVLCSLWENHIGVIAELRGRSKEQLLSALDTGRVVLNPPVEASVSVSSGNTRIHLPTPGTSGSVSQSESQPAVETPVEETPRKTSDLDKAPE